MQTIEGIYHNGYIKLLETPKEIGQARVIVTFLEDEMKASNQQLLSNLGEILDDDLEAASLEISKQFLKAIEKSGDEVQR